MSEQNLKNDVDEKSSSGDINLQNVDALDHLHSIVRIR